MTVVEFLALDLGLLAVILVWWLWVRVRERNAWPLSAPRHWCAECGTSYLGQRGLLWHRQAMHPDTYGENVEITRGCWYPSRQLAMDDEPRPGSRPRPG